MTKLFYIDNLDIQISDVLKQINKEDKVFIFSSSQNILKNYTEYGTVLTYSSLGIDASNGFFEGACEEAFSLTSKMIKAVVNMPVVNDERQQTLIESIDGKLHRVISECIRSERVVGRLLDFCKPDKIYIFRTNQLVFTETINNVTNFEKDCLSSLNNNHIEIIEKNIERKNRNFFLSRVKNIAKVIINNIKYVKMMINAIFYPLASNKYTYVHIHKYYLNKYSFLLSRMNHSTKENYLIVAENFDYHEQENLIQKYKNLRFLFYRALYPTSKLQNRKLVQELEKILLEKVYNTKKPMYLNILLNYLYNFSFTYYKEYLNNINFVETKTRKCYFNKAYFLSFWDVQHSMQIRKFNKENVDTFSYQSGFALKMIAERTFTKYFGVFSKEEEEKINSLYKKYNYKTKLFIEPNNFQSVSNISTDLTSSSDKKRVLILLSMSGSWQHFIYFPEEEIIRDIIEVAKENQNLEFVLRGRVGDSFNDYFRRMNPPANLKIDINIALADSIKEADFVFSQSTTAAYESILSGILTIYLGLHSYNDDFPLRKLDDDYIVNSVDDFLYVLKKFKSFDKNYFKNYWDNVEEKILNFNDGI